MSVFERIQLKQKIGGSKCSAKQQRVRLTRKENLHVPLKGAVNMCYVLEKKCVKCGDCKVFIKTFDYKILVIFSSIFERCLLRAPSFGENNNNNNQLLTFHERKEPCLSLLGIFANFRK